MLHETHRALPQRHGRSGGVPEAGPSRAPVLAWEGVLGNRGTAAALKADSRTEMRSAEYRLRDYPHHAEIRSAFGFAVPGAAILDPATCAAHGTPALTEGSVTRFASADPSLKVAAHEAVHLAQHAGLTRDAGLGPEKHAHTVATAISSGHPAGQWIGGRGSAVAPHARSYTEIAVDAQTVGQWDAGMDLRVAEDGRMAVGQSNPLHDFWADPANIGESNRILGNVGSAIRLRERPVKLKGRAPDGSSVRTLSQVMPENVFNASGGTDMEIWADCGRCARDVTGAGGGSGGGPMTGLYRDQDKPWWASIPLLGPLLAWIFGVPGPTQQQTTASDPEDMKKEIFNQRLGGTGDEGLRRYMAKSADERDEFDRETGINRYAAPTTGEGYTTSSGGTPVGPKTWNFHWGGVVMNSGSDRVVLENYAVGSRPEDAVVRNSDWEFQMYGPAQKPGQTFHEQHQASGTHGSDPTSVRVRKR